MARVSNSIAKVGALLSIAFVMLVAITCFSDRAFAFPEPSGDIVAATPQQLEAQTDKSSAELSDDGKDYRWFYRKGDILYRISDYEENEAHGPYTLDELRWRGEFGCYKGQWYDMPNYLDRVKNANPNAYENSHSVYEFYYRQDNAVLYTAGPYIRMESILKADSYPPVNENLWVSQVFCDGLYNENVYPRINTCKFYRQYGGYVKNDMEDIEIIDIDESAFGHWGPGHDNANDTEPWEVTAVRLDRWFEGCVSLKEVQGLEHITACNVITMSNMFKDCGIIENIDISKFETAACTDFGGMFDGCESLVTLKTGEGWTQSGAEADKKATFPHDMACTRNGVRTVYREGEVIPDGAAEYTAANRRSIKSAQVLLLDTAKAGAQPSKPPISCEYTGSQVKPQVQVTLGTTQLREGVDFSVTYANNVEDGAASAIITGMGAYYGRLVADFTIVDTAAYVFLYENGRMFFKQNHHAPNVQDVSASEKLLLKQRWFEMGSANPGATVPWADYADKVKSVTFYDSFKTFKPTTARKWFANCTALTSVIGLEHLNAARLTSLEGMFENCTSLSGVEGLEHLSGTVVTSLQGMFRNCTSIINLDISNLEAPNAAKLDGLVDGCTSLETLTLGGIATSAAADFSKLLDGASNLKTLKTTSGWQNKTGAKALTFPTRSFCSSDSYKLYKAGAAVPSGAGEYRMRDLPLQFAYIIMNGPKFTSTGKAVKPAIRVMLGETQLKRGTDYTVTYKNNVYPGKASLTVKGKGTFTGGLVVPFTIVSRVTKVGDRLIYENDNVKYTLKVTKVTKSGGVVTGANASLVSVKVKKGTLRTMAIPDMCTIAGVKVGITEVSSKLVGQFRNVSCISIGAKVVKIGPNAFAKVPKVKKLLVKSSRLKSVKNCLRASNVKRVETRVYLDKARKATYKTWFTKKAGKAGVKFVYGFYFAVV